MSKDDNTAFKVFTRREMLELTAKFGAGAAAFSLGATALDFFTPSASAENIPLSPHEAMFYKKLTDKRVKCLLCPRRIVLRPGERCFCKTRKNIDGKLYAMGYDKPCIVNFEPVERAPLCHFLPDTRTMSLGAAGCNMNCLYCQNYELAQTSPENAPAIKLNQKEAIKKGQIKSVTLTYTDAACQPEYLMTLSENAKSFDLPLILCTGGYINPKPLKKMIPHVNAFAVTLKAATDDMYVKLTEAHMKPVLESLKMIRESNKWLEVITLIVPGYNDDRKGISRLAKWIKANLGAQTPWHLSRFTPNYKLKRTPPTPRKTLEEARKVGMDAGLEYVYITNLAPHEGNHTYCPSCGKKLIERLGFKTRKSNLRKGKCPHCQTEIPGIWG
jgi:pyruvate formate lyase activating enzyme